MKLYSYWRSSASFRVRAALNLKGLRYEIVPVDLTMGAQHGSSYRALNPAAAVPTLILPDGIALTQSLAIIDYLDSVSEPRLVPSEPTLRAKVLAAAHTVAMDIHPVNNLRVLQKLKNSFDATDAALDGWITFWMSEGFAALEAQINKDCQFCFGDTPGVADLCLVAQVYNARRRAVDLKPFPNVQRVGQACLQVPAIAAAHPDQQPDAKAA